MSTYGDLEKLNRPGLPVPTVTEMSRPHWDGCRRGELMVQRCSDCGAYIFIPEIACNQCLSANLDWVQSSGRGEFYSFTVIHRPQRPEFDAPYVGAIIELEEGLPVEVCFVPRSDVVLPMFRIVEK